MRIPERDVTYIVLSVYLLTLPSPIRHKTNHNQVLKRELELDFAQYVQYTDVRIADLFAVPYIYRVTSYLRLLDLTCSQNMSFLARLLSNNSRNLEKGWVWGTVLPRHAEEKILHGFEVLVHGYLCVRFDFSSLINFRDINGFPKLGTKNPYYGSP